jgi:hypothetical protein
LLNVEISSSELDTGIPCNTGGLQTPLHSLQYVNLIKFNIMPWYDTSSKNNTFLENRVHVYKTAHILICDPWFYSRKNLKYHKYK